MEDKNAKNKQVEQVTHIKLKGKKKKQFERMKILMDQIDQQIKEKDIEKMTNYALITTIKDGIIDKDSVDFNVDAYFKNILNK